MYTMSEKTRKNVECGLGMPLSQFASLSALEEERWVQEKTGSHIIFSKIRKNGRIGRGNPLLARRKLRTKEDLDRISERLFGI